MRDQPPKPYALQRIGRLGKSGDYRSLENPSPYLATGSAKRLA